MDESTLPRFMGCLEGTIKGTVEQQDYMLKAASGHGNRSCKIQNGFCCTREVGHQGPHIAKALGTNVVAVWDGEK